MIYKDPYTNDRERSDRCLWAVRSIVGAILVQPANDFQDTREATDLIILTLPSNRVRIAARVRGHAYMHKNPNYLHQFTMRHKRDSGTKTEFAKVREGFGDLMFYGFEGEIEGTICRWVIVDLHAWRWHVENDAVNLRADTQSNHDGTHFVWFDIRSFLSQPQLVVAASFPVNYRDP